MYLIVDRMISTLVISRIENIMGCIRADIIYKMVVILNNNSNNKKK